MLVKELATSDADRKDYDAALEWIEKALAIDPKYGFAHLLKGGMLREKSDRNGAVRERMVHQTGESHGARADTYRLS